MDARLLVLLGSLGLLGFLFYPRPQLPPQQEAGVWVATMAQVPGERGHFPTTARTDPVVATYDLGFIYRADRVEVTFDNPAENGPKVFEVLVSPARDGPYRRAFTYRAASRFYPYTVQTFPDAAEGRWVQVVVSDWFSGKPSVKAFRAGALYRRDWNPIRTVSVSHNPSAASLLVDGLRAEDSKWSGARRVEVAAEREGKKVTEIALRPPNGDVWVLADLGLRQRVYGTRITTDGPGNNVRAYEVWVSDDGRDFVPAHTSAQLADETASHPYVFPEPLMARFVQFTIPQGAWYGDYPELREVEVFTDPYRLAPFPTEDMAAHNATRIYYDDCGYDGRRSPNLVQGFPYDRGATVDPAGRFVWRAGDDIEGPAEESSRSFAYHYDTLRFRYAGLHPNRLYWLQATYLQNKGGGRAQNLVADGYLLHGDEVPVPSASTPASVFFVPPAAVADGALDVSVNRLAGPNAVVSALALFEAPKGDEPAAPPEPAEPAAKATRTAGPIRVDGVLDEWDRLYPLRSADDADAPEVLLSWDDENLYAAASTRRGRLGGRPGVADALDLFFDSRHTRSPSMYRRGDVHLRFYGFGGAEVPRFIYHFSDETLPRADAPPVEFRSGRDGDRYVLEARLPRHGVLDDWEPKHGGRFGFNYILSGREGVEAYWASPNPADPPSRWRTVEMLGSVQGEWTFYAQPPPDAREAGVPRPTQAFSAGDTLWLVLRDPDANRDRDAQDTVSVSLSGDATGETRRLELREIDLGALFTAGLQRSAATDSEYFAAAVTTAYGRTPSGIEGVVAVQGGEALTATYTDTLFAPGSPPREVSGAVRARVGATATLRVVDADGKDITWFAAGDTLRFLVDDRDLMEELSPPAGADVGGGASREFRMPVRAVDDRVDAGPSDTAYVTMVQVEPNVFAGSLATQYAESPADDDVLQVVGLRTVQAVYVDAIQETGQTRVPVTASARARIGATGRLRLRVVGGDFPNDPADVVSFAAGDRLVARLEDEDLNGDPASVEQAVVHVEGDVLQDRAAATLDETAPNTGVFIGSVATRFARNADPESPSVEIQGGETVTFTYEDAIEGSGATRVSVVARAQARTGHDGTLAIVRGDYQKPFARFNAGDTLYLRLDEVDDIGEAALVELVADSGDREAVRLFASADSPSEYIGSVPTTFGARPAPNDGVLHVVGGDTVRAGYVDALRASGETAVRAEASARANSGNDGSMTVSRRTHPLQPAEQAGDGFRAGDVLLVEVRDADLNTFSEVVEQVAVTVREDYADDGVEVALRETSGNSAVFQGEVRTEYGEAVAADGVLQVQAQSVVSVRYTDALTAAGAVQVPRTHTLYVQAGARGRVEMLAEDGLRPIASLSARDTVVIRVHDTDLDRDPALAEGAAVRVEGNLLGDVLDLPLRETGAHTGVFEARLATDYARARAEAIAGDLLLHVADKEMLTVTYLDALVNTGQPDVPVLARAVVAGSSPGDLLIVDATGQEIGAFRAGDVLFLRLRDLVLTTMAPAEPIRVRVSGSVTEDTVEVPMFGAPGEPGHYWGSVPTRFGTAPVADGTLDVQGGEEVMAAHQPSLPDVFPYEIVDTAMVAAGVRGRLTIVRPDGFPLPHVTPGEALHLRLEDADRNTRPEAADTVDVSVGVDERAVSRTVRLAETGPNTGVFSGEIWTTLGARGTGSASLPLRGGEAIAAVHRDPLTDAGETNVEVVAGCRARYVGFAPFSDEPVLVDGVPDRWPLESAMETRDGEARVWAQWDRDALYLFAQVRDEDVRVKDVTRWYRDGDALEIHLDTSAEERDRPSHLAARDGETAVALWLTPKGGGLDGRSAYVGRLRPTRQNNYSPPVQVVAREDNFGYALEVRIPFGLALPGFDPITSSRLDRLGFNFLLYRSDAPQVWWAEVRERDEIPSALGVLYLQRSPVESRRAPRTPARRVAAPAPQE
jgi:hypothetical protein